MPKPIEPGCLAVTRGYSMACNNDVIVTVQRQWAGWLPETSPPGVYWVCETHQALSVRSINDPNLVFQSKAFVTHTRNLVRIDGEEDDIGISETEDKEIYEKA